MSNIHDYLAWRGDVPFSVSPFNEVDALVLSELAYANFKGVVAESGERVTIEEANRRFWRLHTKKEIMAQDRADVPSDLVNVLFMGIPVFLLGLLVIGVIERFKKRSYRLPTEQKRRKKKTDPDDFPDDEETDEAEGKE